LRKRILVGFFCILLISLFAVDQTSISSIMKIEKEHTAILSDYVVHDTIQIFSDDDFETQGWPGSGTDEDPYVIEGLSIDGWGAPSHCILLRHFVSSAIVRNCFLHSGNGITVYNTTGNILIENCHFVDMETGIKVDDYVSMVNITNNVFYHIYGAQGTNTRAFVTGTHVVGATIIIYNNTILDGSYAYVQDVDNTVIINNLFKIRFEYANSSGVVENNCFNSSMNTFDQSHGLDFDFNFYKAYNGSDDNLDGIGDTPYSFNKTSDEHPLMYWPWTGTLSTTTTLNNTPSTTTTSNTTQNDQILVIMIISVVGGVCGIVSLILVIFMIRKK